MLEPDVIGVELELRALRPLAREPPRDARTRVVYEAAARDPRARARAEGGDGHARGRGDVGSPNRILREEIGGKVIVRTGRRIPGVVPLGGVHAPISVVRMAVGDAYGAKEWREGEGDDEVAFRTERIERAHLPRGRRVRVPAGRAQRRQGLRRAEVHRQPDLRGDAEGGDGRGRRAPSRRAVRAAADRRDVRAPHLVERRAARHPGAEPRRRHPLRPRAAALRLDRRLGVAARRLRRRLRADRGHGRGGARHGARARRARTSRTRWR